MQLITIQILTAWCATRDRLAEAYRVARDDERGELTGNVILLAALAVAAAAVGAVIVARIQRAGNELP